MAEAVMHSVCNAVVKLEDLHFPSIRFSFFVKSVCVGIPLSVLAYDTSALWMPTFFRIPILSWFQRRWTVDPQNQLIDLQVLRNAIFFVMLVILASNTGEGSNPIPSTYLEPRLVSSHAVREMSKEIQQARDVAFQTAVAVLGEEEQNFMSAEGLREAALRRRYHVQSRSS